MSAPSPVLAAIDFSPASQQTLAAAASLAHDLRTRIVLVHALESFVPPEATARATTKSETLSKAATSLAQHAEESVQKATEWANQLRGQGLEVEPVARAGRPATLILEEAERHKCGMIVVGTEGRTGVRRWLLGSVAQEVLRQSPIPVLVTPVRMGRTPGGLSTTERSILVATDFSEDADVAFEAALRLAKDLRCPIRLLHVVEIPFTNPSYPYSEAMVSPEMLGRDEEQAAADLALLASRAGVLGVSVVPMVDVGHPPSCILAAARESGAALIAVGTHGKSGIRRFLLGSVAQAITQLADRPVLVVPNRAAKEAGEWVR